MTRRMLVMAILGVAMWLAIPQDASGFGKRRGDCCEPCASPCPQQYTVSYVDKKVTCYKPQMKTRDVKVMVSEWIDTKETFKCMVAEPVVTKQKVTVPEMRTKQEPYKYCVTEMHPEKQKVKACDYQRVEKEIDVVSCKMVPTTTVVKRTVCERVCVPVTVTKVVTPRQPRQGLLARCCNKPCDDPCAPPPPPPCPQVITCTVMQKQTITKIIDVPCTTYQRVEVKSKQKVCEMQPVWVERDVIVNKCVQVEKQGMRTVCFTVPVEKEIDVRTCKYVEKTETRIVKKCVPVEKIVKQTYCEMVPYETTVKVPVYTPCATPVPAPTPCASPCTTPCATTSACCDSGRGGRFRGRMAGGCCR
ncbi:MAG TPA: hypothetical protein VLM40_13670 [Gemmata sp.]|nr:hypothetical protein [Gemmata sp.]